ncbi:hypothetical protein HK101_000351 [Irineochytrium annulatum]|nr:hypothetical protein HK101_000351 [Irineochytrium annulatum]
MSIAPYTAEYVRRVSCDPAQQEKIVTSLTRLKAYEVKEELVVAMVGHLRDFAFVALMWGSNHARFIVRQIDISGYSKMSAELAVLGRIASELIARSVAVFMDKIIEVISLYHGDIVKFLGMIGDAVLVVFTPRAGESVGNAILRTLACCLHIGTRYSTLVLDLSLADQTSGIGEEHQRRHFPGRVQELSLHFGITHGEVSRLFLGDPAIRLDYSIYGDCLSSLSALLDGTKKG